MEVPTEIYMELSDGSILVQGVDYEWYPKFCSECMTWGHSTGDCDKEQETVHHPQNHAPGPKKKRAKRRKRPPPRQWLPKNVENGAKALKGKEKKVEEVQDLGVAEFPKLHTTYPLRRTRQTSKTHHIPPIADVGQNGSETEQSCTTTPQDIPAEGLNRAKAPDPPPHK
ncbi:hypothetical protein K7X08_002569 [Anisodus acutangulus]|uniref:Zinc knuckle CX2CX4HX4C domain-containing protein n=1 Tax=Anisodus acutangulus TaxID=402998 RepID=A0A9Q1LPF9_9SOLA|nr:hypothetical protein K7X08_002569 [Anisodus acutangulus]